MYFDQCPCLSSSIVFLIDDLSFFQDADSGERVFAVSMMAMDFLVPNFDDFLIQFDSRFSFSFNAFVTRESPLNRVEAYDMVRDSV